MSIVLRAPLRFAAVPLFALGLVPAAHAGDELHLRWDDCITDGGVYNKVFACDTNAGTDVLVGSFRLAATTESVTGLTFILNLTVIGPTLPAWWDLRSSGGCRAGSLTSSFSPPPTSSACLDPWSSLGAGGTVYETVGAPDQSRIRAQVFLPFPNEFAVPADQEHFAFQLRIDRRFATGASTCAGCATPMCIGWTEAQLFRRTPLPALHIVGWETPNNGSMVTWQPGAVASMVGYCPPNRNCITEMVCQSETPALNKTWGSIKSLYR